LRIAHISDSDMRDAADLCAYEPQLDVWREAATDLAAR
jgi:hypothetical protein